MNTDSVRQFRKLAQWHAFATIQMHEAIARKAGFSGTEHKYLGFLIEKGQMTAGELATLSGLTTGAITGMIDRFEKKKLVKRMFSEDDRRKVIIVPNTGKVMALMAPLYKEFRKRSEELYASLSGKEMEIIKDYFEQSIAIMNETTVKLSEKSTKKSK